MTQTITATDHPITDDQIAAARAEAEDCDRQAAFAADRHARTGMSGEWRAEATAAAVRAERARERLEELLRQREVLDAANAARQAAEADAGPALDALAEEFEVSRKRLGELVDDAESALLAVMRHAVEHDALVVRAQEVLRGHGLVAMPSLDFDTVATDRGVRVRGQWWSRLDAAGVLARTLKRITRATLPWGSRLTQQADGLARGYAQHLDPQMFTEAPDLGEAMQPRIVRPERADLRVS